MNAIIREMTMLGLAQTICVRVGFCSVPDSDLPYVQPRGQN